MIWLRLGVLRLLLTTCSLLSLGTCLLGSMSAMSSFNFKIESSKRQTVLSIIDESNCSEVGLELKKKIKEKLDVEPSLKFRSSKKCLTTLGLKVKNCRTTCIKAYFFFMFNVTKRLNL